MLPLLIFLPESRRWLAKLGKDNVSRAKLQNFRRMLLFVAVDGFSHLGYLLCPCHLRIYWPEAQSCTYDGRCQCHLTSPGFTHSDLQHRKDWRVSTGDYWFNRSSPFDVGARHLC